jgi:two-component system chemotaxis response regulator CheB
MNTQPTPKTGKHPRDIVVIGTSAGGVTALLALAKALPADFPAPIFVVLHVAADSPSIMPELLNAVTALQAKHPQNGELVQAGVIYLAPPDHHLLLEDDRVLVTRGQLHQGHDVVGRYKFQRIGWHGGLLGVVRVLHNG